MIQHFSMNIQGAIENARDLKGCITVDGKTLNTVAEIRKFLRGQLVLGRKCLPVSRCSNFDYQTGCKGHEHPEKWLKLRSIGLNTPTEVEDDEGKTLVTVGLGMDELIRKWKEHFGFSEDATIWLEAEDALVQSLSGQKQESMVAVKTVRDLLAERGVYFWEEHR